MRLFVLEPCHKMFLPGSHVRAADHLKKKGLRRFKQFQTFHALVPSELLSSPLMCVCRKCTTFPALRLMLRSRGGAEPETRRFWPEDASESFCSTRRDLLITSSVRGDSLGSRRMTGQIRAEEMISTPQTLQRGLKSQDAGSGRF